MGVLRDLCIFWINICGYVCQILRRNRMRGFLSLHSIREQPRKDPSWTGSSLNLYLQGIILYQFWLRIFVFLKYHFSRKSLLWFKNKTSYFESKPCFSRKMALSDFLKISQVYLNEVLVYSFLICSCTIIKSNISSALSMAVCDQLW